MAVMFDLLINYFNNIMIKIIAFINLYWIWILKFIMLAGFIIIIVIIILK